MLHRLSALAALVLLAPLAACPSDPEPLTPVALVEIDCGRADCESGAPLASGARLVVQPDTLAVVTSLRPVDATVASVALDPAATDETWIVTGRRPGATELELLDARGRVVGTYTLKVAAIDHFEAASQWFLGGRVYAGEHLRSDEPHYFGQPGRLRIMMKLYAGTTELRGALDFQIDLDLPAASRVLENHPSGDVFIEARSGENLMTFGAAGRTETFRFTVF